MASDEERGDDRARAGQEHPQEAEAVRHLQHLHAHLDEATEGVDRPGHRRRRRLARFGIHSGVTVKLPTAIARTAM
ncbi:MAG: hypothetical protein E6J85_13820 [Deltaproteobacteria bacterium]|nr:MAG: hypothetical protein E6J85_13820 [Deltaproteobacteria bacterium]